VSSPARRHAERRDGERTPVTVTTLRIAELRRLFRARYGHVLPDDDAGRDDALIMANHLARGPDAERRIGLWIGLWAPWMPGAEAGALVSKVIARPIRWRADKLAQRLHLTETERTRLKITTIGAVDVSKEERATRRKLRKRFYLHARRRKAGAKLRVDYEANSISRSKPWERLGMSRASWYRAGKPTP
jgi:hypothetical protein